jgi:hypothetical protein
MAIVPFPIVLSLEFAVPADRDYYNRMIATLLLVAALQGSQVTEPNTQVKSSMELQHPARLPEIVGG